MGLSRLLNVIPFILPGQGVPADVLPPPEEMAALEAQVLVVLGAFLVIVVGILILAIRVIREYMEIRRNNTRKD